MTTKCNLWSWTGSQAGEEVTAQGSMETISKTCNSITIDCNSIQ